MPHADVVFTELDPAMPAAVSLVSALDSELGELYPGIPIPGIELTGFRSSGGVFLVGTIDAVAVACGALRPLSDSIGELKRIFVRKDQRRRGLGRATLVELERIAARRGYKAIRLETGAYQPEAIRLYESAGYHSIPCFDDLSGHLSRCFEKSLPV